MSNASAAGRSKQHLLAAMVVGVICFRMGRPRNGTHPGRGDGLEDRLVRYFAFVGGDRHAAIQDIEGEPIRAANERPNGLLEHRNFFCAIQPAHLVGTTGTERRAAGALASGRYKRLRRAQACVARRDYEYACRP